MVRDFDIKRHRSQVETFFRRQTIELVSEEEFRVASMTKNHVF